jgi:hypothetical protein
VPLADMAASLADPLGSRIIAQRSKALCGQSGLKPSFGERLPNDRREANRGTECTGAERWLQGQQARVMLEQVAPRPRPANEAVYSSIEMGR